MGSDWETIGRAFRVLREVIGVFMFGYDFFFMLIYKVCGLYDCEIDIFSVGMGVVAISLGVGCKCRGWIVFK